MGGGDGGAGGSVCVCVCACMCECVCACSYVCAWDKGITKKRGEKEGKSYPAKSAHYGFKPITSCLWGNCAKLCTTA